MRAAGWFGMELLALHCLGLINTAMLPQVGRMKQSIPDATYLDVDTIKVFVSRARTRDEFDDLKASIKSVGLKMPIQVRDITDRPAADRRREEGGHFKYELICGEGRLQAFKELKIQKIPALIISAAESEIVGRFLAENMIRTPLPWAEKAKLVKGDLDKGLSHEAVAKKYFITKNHALKFERILNKTATGLEQVVPRLTMNEAELLTALPAEHQTIVIETLQETGQREISALVRKAREVTETEGELSKTALKKSLDRVGKDMVELKEKATVKHLHWTLGPQNLKDLLKNAKMKAALKKQGVNLKKFEALISR